MKHQINCLLVDDEPLARELMLSFIQKISFLNPVAICENAFDAAELLQSNPVDLLITDIQMPQINGIELIKSLPYPPAIIITTAFPDFAIDGFDLGVVDYLVKPVSFDRFFKAINKVKLALEIGKQKTSEKAVPALNHLFVKDGYKLTKVLFDDIVYIEGLKDYIKVVARQRNIVTYMRMKNIEEILPPTLFFRTHKSYIINLLAIKSIIGNSIEMINSDSITISRQNKSQLTQLLGITNIEEAD